MNVLVVGAGVVGESLAEQLSQEGHRVAIVDRSTHKLAALSERIDVLTVPGNAGMLSVMERAGIRSAHMVIAVTDVDEVNLVVGMLAARMGVRHRIVRIRNPEYLSGGVLRLEELGIDHVINPDPHIVDAIRNMIRLPGVTDYSRLAGGQVVILGFDVGVESPAAGKSMIELREAGGEASFLVLYIVRKGEVMVPRGGDRLAPGDSVHVLVEPGTAPRLMSLLQRKPEPVRHVIVAGASRIGLSICEAIQGEVEKVFLLEPREEAAEEAATRLDSVTVLHGEETSTELLREANIEGCDLFCSASDDDQRNILSALLAKKMSRKRAAVIVQQPQYMSVLDSLGVEIVLNPRLVTVGEILMHVRRGHIHSVTRVAESRAEIIELEAAEGSPVTRGKIKSAGFPQHAIVGAIVANGAVRIPTGEDAISQGDTVITFALPDAIRRVEKLFAQGGKG